METGMLFLILASISLLTFYFLRETEKTHLKTDKTNKNIEEIICILKTHLELSVKEKKIEDSKNKEAEISMD